MRADWPECIKHSNITITIVISIKHAPCINRAVNRFTYDSKHDRRNGNIAESGYGLIQHTQVDINNNRLEILIERPSLLQQRFKIMP